MLCKPLAVVEAVVWCVLVWLWWQFVVQFSCSVSVTVAVGCCGCGSGVVVGARGGAGDVRCSSLLPRVVVGEVAAVTAATQAVGCLDVEEVVLPAAAVVASAAGSCLVEAVEEGNVENPVAKAKAGC